VPRVVVDVMLKPEILDPQGQAVVGALPRLGISAVTGVRQGKRFELEIDGELTDDRLGEVRRLAETLLANPVIEDFDVRIADGGFDGLGSGGAGEPVGASNVTARASVAMPEIASELERAMAAERATSSTAGPASPAATVPPPDPEPEPSSEDPTASQPAVSPESSVAPSVQPESSVKPTSTERDDRTDGGSADRADT
jgi:phosphoribosylformylglycinamidine synthase PurS subunit